MTFTEVLALLDSIVGTKLFVINQTPITIGSLVMFAIVLMLFSLGSRLLRALLFSRMLSRVPIEEGTRYNLNRTPCSSTAR